MKEVNISTGDHLNLEEIVKENFGDGSRMFEGVLMEPNGKRYAEALLNAAGSRASLDWFFPIMMLAVLIEGEDGPTLREFEERIRKGPIFDFSMPENNCPYNGVLTKEDTK